MEFKHKSVLLEETIDGLNVKPDGIYVDGTLGGAGHALEVCKKLSAKGRFIGIDQDQDAIIAASERLDAYKDQTTIIRSNYCYMVQELRARGINQVDGAHIHHEDVLRHVHHTDSHIYIPGIGTNTHGQRDPGDPFPAHLCRLSAPTL